MSFAGVILILGLLCLLLVSKPFRRLAGVLLVITVIGVLILVAWWQESEAQQKRKRELAKSYIRTNQIEVIDPRISFSNYDGRPNRVIGRIRNNSAYTLETVQIHLVFQDCLPDNRCETVDDEQDDIYIGVPPNQSRDFDKYISGSPLSPKGKIEWNYRFTSVSAKMD
jgi:hypothetical protein